MYATVPGLTADQVLRTFQSEAFTRFLGAAIAATGLVAAAFAAIRRQRSSLLIYFALFAILYGGRMWLQTRLFGFMLGGSSFFIRLQSAINYVVPVPAFLFFDVAGFLRRKIRIVTYSFFAIFAFLALATLIGHPSDLYAQINNVMVIVVLVLLITEPMRGLSADQDFIIARRGLLTFGAFALWDNLIPFIHLRLPRIEPLGFVALLACLGYVAARQSLERDEQLAEIQKELEVARRIQLSILPSDFPASGKFQIAARYVPMTSVAGDLYDYVVAESTRAGLLIADVAGHGVPAALIASMVKLAATTQRSHASNPAAVLLGMNSALHGNTQSQFVTAAYVYLDAQANELRYSAAGHPPMLLLRDGMVTEIAENGLMLAAFDFATYDTTARPLQQGDRLLLYTDGILEAADSSGEFFGQTNLSKLLQDTITLSAQKAADHIIHSVQKWAASQDDDLTVLICDYIA